MGLSDVVARLAEVVGATAIWLRRSQGTAGPAFGASPTIPPAKPQGNIPTLKMPTAKGWPQGRTPVAAPGLKVNAFATGLKHPRWIHVLPSGEVLVAEALMEKVPIASFFDYAMFSTLKRAAAVGPSPNRITLLRDRDGDGAAEIRDLFLDGLNQPFGMALVGDTFYVGNTDGVVAFPYAAGSSRITAPGRKLIGFKTDGHWTRSLLANAEGTKLYAGVGSLTNIADDGMAAEEGRAAIYELDLKSGASRIFASGLRNPVGLAFEPSTGTLWTVVNERFARGASTAGPIAIGGKRRTTACRRIRLRSLARLRPIMRSADILPRSVSAGCPPARFPGFRKAWRSDSTAPGIAARSPGTGSCSCHSPTGVPRVRRATCSPASSPRTSDPHMDGRLGSRSDLMARCWSPTTSAT